MYKNVVKTFWCIQCLILSTTSVDLYSGREQVKNDADESSRIATVDENKINEKTQSYENDNRQYSLDNKGNNVLPNAIKEELMKGHKNLFKLCESMSICNDPKALETAEANEDKYGEGFGYEWMFFPDGNGVPYLINMTDVPTIMGRGLDVFDIDYKVYTKEDINKYTLLDYEAASMNKNDALNEKMHNLPIKIITHGWRSSSDVKGIQKIKNEYLKSQDVVVIIIDWSEHASNILYPIVASQTKGVGRQIGKFLDALSKRYDIPGDRIHLIGHSLGAHVMGNAAAHSKIREARLTGLDPARPFFELPSVPESDKLDISDAEFVDVIHTCAGIIGVENNIGHADFYPNSGRPPQPECNGLFKMFFESCSHGMSQEYFAESINNPRAFKANNCNNWNDYTSNRCIESNLVFMGDKVNQTARGSYYLRTA